jgi:four helix bundle protein
MKYDLEERTRAFARRVVGFVRVLPRGIANNELSRQLVRSGCSVAANYIEANESLGDKDLLMRMRICRKEAKETFLWLDLVEGAAPDENERRALRQEADELTRIFGAIVTKREARMRHD